MDIMVVALTFFIGYFVFINIVILFFIYRHFSFNIPVTILRFVGNKGRPLLIQKKAKKIFRNGIPLLLVQGYREKFRDFLSENYYPSVRGKYGGLILWEFEDGLLTPVIPHKVLRTLSKEQLAACDEAQKLALVGFDYNEHLTHELRLKAVDDVDNEFLLQERARLEGQYSGGWKDFLMKYTGHFVVLIIGVLFLVGLILWFQNMPTFAAQCYGAAKEIISESLLEQAASRVAPAG